MIVSDITSGKLALITCYNSSPDHFEAIREGYRFIFLNLVVARGHQFLTSDTNSMISLNITKNPAQCMRPIPVSAKGGDVK